MQADHALLSKLCATARLGVEVVLSLSAHQNLTVLGNFEAFGK